MGDSMKKKIAEIINVIFGFRKFLLMAFVVVIAIVFRVKDYIDGAEMVDLLKNVSIAFMGANGIEHIVGAVSKYMDQKQANSEPEGPADTDDGDDNQEVEDVK
jgi:hypothetical protein